MSITTFKFTVEEYHRLIDTGVFDRRRVELINGELIELSPEKPFHAGTNNRLFGYLFLKFQNLACIRPNSPITLVTSEPEPDIVICRFDKDEYLKNHPMSKDIYAVIELSNSTLNFDLTEKKKIYAKDNIFEYWVVDLNNRQINKFTKPLKNEYQQHEIIVSGSVVFSQFPNIILEAQQFFP